MAHQDIQIEPDRDAVASIRERLVGRAFACTLRQRSTAQQGGEHRRGLLGNVTSKMACFSGPAQHLAHRDGKPKEDSDSLLVLTHDTVEVLEWNGVDLHAESALQSTDLTLIPVQQTGAILACRSTPHLRRDLFHLTVPWVRGSPSCCRRHPQRRATNTATSSRCRRLVPTSPMT